MEETLIYKKSILKILDSLTPELLFEVNNFIDFLKLRYLSNKDDETLFLHAQQENLKQIWYSEEEDLYDIQQKKSANRMIRLF
jgi:hypothetical protein